MKMKRGVDHKSYNKADLLPLIIFSLLFFLFKISYYVSFILIYIAKLNGIVHSDPNHSRVNLNGSLLCHSDK